MKNNKLLFYIFLVLLPLFSFSQKMDKIHFEQVGKQIHIYYDLHGNGTYDVQVFCSTDNGRNWSEPLRSVIGSIGENRQPGYNKEIIWDVLADREEIVGDIIFKVIAFKSNDIKNEQNIKIEYEKGKIALDLGNAQQSINSFRFIIENSNDKDLIASSYGNLGIAYMLLDNSLESITMFEQACKMDQKQYCHQSAFNKGLLFEKEGKYNKAIEEYKECIALEPYGKLTKILRGYNNMNYRSHFNIGNIYAMHYGDCNSAIKHYLASIQTYDEETLGDADWRMDAINNIAFCYYELGDFMKCIEYNKIILETNKYDKDALVSICYAYDNLGDKKNAEKYCKMASELGDDRAKDYLNN